MNQARRPWIELATELIAFAILVASVTSLWRHNLLLLGVTLVECVVALRLWHARLDLCFFLVIAVLGTLAEAVFVHCGVWHYANPSLLGIPLWFPLAFGTTALIGVRLAGTAATLWDRISPAAGQAVRS